MYLKLSLKTGRKSLNTEECWQDKFGRNFLLNVWHSVGKVQNVSLTQKLLTNLGLTILVKKIVFLPGSCIACSLSSCNCGLRPLAGTSAAVICQPMARWEVAVWTNQSQARPDWVCDHHCWMRSYSFLFITNLKNEEKQA